MTCALLEGRIQLQIKTLFGCLNSLIPKDDSASVDKSLQALSWPATWWLLGLNSSSGFTASTEFEWTITTSDVCWRVSSWLSIFPSITSTNPHEHFSTAKVCLNIFSSWPNVQIHATGHNMRQSSNTTFSTRFLQSFQANFTAHHFFCPFNEPSCFVQTPGVLSSVSAWHPGKYEFCEDGQREKMEKSKEPEGTDRRLQVTHLVLGMKEYMIIHD